MTFARSPGNGWRSRAPTPRTRDRSSSASTATPARRGCGGFAGASSVITSRSPITTRRPAKFCRCSRPIPRSVNGRGMRRCRSIRDRDPVSHASPGAPLSLGVPATTSPAARVCRRRRISMSRASSPGSCRASGERRHKGLRCCLYRVLDDALHATARGICVARPGGPVGHDRRKRRDALRRVAAGERRRRVSEQRRSR